MSTLFLLLLTTLPAAESPASVAELWADFDPRKDPLETEVIREWTEDGIVLQHVRYRIGTFRDAPARMAAIYGYPAGTTKKLPGVMHIHGGGQRASLGEVKMLAARGYAALSVNWGGARGNVDEFNAPEGAHPGDPNTDWGVVDPSQRNVAGYSSMLPGPKQVFTDREDPRNCNWYLLTLGCRRGLTFLEQQPQVDPERLGVHGYSMGGNLTMYVAGTDDRVKAAVPGVGGQGWRWETHPFLDVPQNRVQGDVDVFRRTLSFESYAPLIKCPLLHRSATNDFHGWMDDVYRTDALIQNQPVQHAWSPHLNHRLTPEVAVGMPLWFDHFLQGGPALPETPMSLLLIDTVSGVPQFVVTRESTLPVARCDIYYSVEPDPRARFWRSAQVVRQEGIFTADLPMETLERPLFAFANVSYTLPEAVTLKHLPGYTEPIREVCLSTALHSATVEELRMAKVRVTEKSSLLLDDFSRGWQDWYRLNPGNRDHWQNWTRKVIDPKWRGPDHAELRITLQMSQENSLTVSVIENERRGLSTKQRTYVCSKTLPGASDPQTVVLQLSDFQRDDGVALSSWSHLSELGLTATNPELPVARVPRWNGPLPEFKRLEWYLPTDSVRP